MVENNKEIETLLKNIQKGLKKYSVKDLNSAIVEILQKNGSQQKEIDFVLKIVAQKYKISVKTLVNSRARGEIQEARMLSYCLLHYTLGLSIRHVAKNIFHRWHNSVASALRHYKQIQPEKFRVDKEFEDNLKDCQTQLLNYLNTGQ